MRTAILRSLASGTSCSPEGTGGRPQRDSPGNRAAWRGREQVLLEEDPRKADTDLAAALAASMEEEQLRRSGFNAAALHSNHAMNMTSTCEQAYESGHWIKDRSRLTNCMPRPAQGSTRVSTGRCCTCPTIVYRYSVSIYLTAAGQCAALWSVPWPRMGMTEGSSVAGGLGCHHLSAVARENRLCLCSLLIRPELFRTILFHGVGCGVSRPCIGAKL